jgi:hypothetical protein
VDDRFAVNSKILVALLFLASKTVDRVFQRFKFDIRSQQVTKLPAGVGLYLKKATGGSGENEINDPSRILLCTRSKRNPRTTNGLDDYPLKGQNASSDV